jgi:transposase
MKRRRFTKEFKLEILRELEGKTLAQVCREHNLVPNVVSRWKKEYDSDPHKAFSGNGNLWKEHAEIEKYKRLVGQLYAENEFLKKTLDVLQRRRAEEKRWSR